MEWKEKAPAIGAEAKSSCIGATASISANGDAKQAVNAAERSNAARLLNLYRGSTCGLGFQKWIKRDKTRNKNEFDKRKGIKTYRGQLTEQQVSGHLNEGDTIVGVGPVLDDGTVWWGCIDVDSYDFDYVTEMEKLAKSELPLVPDRSKSGGIHLKVFFSEPVEAELVKEFLGKCAELLDYPGCEIFPKQTKLEGAEKCSSWVFLPYGPQWEMFAEQCGMSSSGNALTLDEYLRLAESKRISRDDLLQYSAKILGKRQRSSKTSGAKHIWPEGFGQRKLDELCELVRTATIHHWDEACRKVFKFGKWVGGGAYDVNAAKDRVIRIEGFTIQ